MSCVALERRVMLAVGYTFDGDTLNVFGTKRSDEILVSVANFPTGSGATVTINGRSHHVPLNDGSYLADEFDLPKEIMVRGGDGNDSVTVIQSFYGAPVTVRGQGGDDEITLNGEYGFAALAHGGVGNDVILLTGGLQSSTDGFIGSYWSGPATLRGGDGDDVIEVFSVRSGELGAARLKLRGDGGDDSLRSGGADDLLDGGDGNDILRGGGGDDRLLGGAGDDVLKGNGGKDMLKGDGGKDRFFGGAGDDLLDMKKKEKRDAGKEGGG